MPRMPAPVDFARIFELAPNAYMILDEELRYVAANPAYLAATSTTLDRLLGRRLFDVFPNDPTDPDDASLHLLRRSLEKVLATGEVDEIALIPYRVPTPSDPDAVRYWSATHTPIVDAAGKARFVLQHTVDVTALHTAASPSSSLRERTGVLARAEAVQASNQRMGEEMDRLRVLFAQAPGFMCVLDGEDHVFRLANEAYLRLIGNREILGKPIRVALPEVVTQGFIELLDRVAATGEPYVGESISVMLQREPDASFEQRFVDFVYQPVVDANGRTRSIFVQGHDVTERRVAQREMEAARRAAEVFAAEVVAQSHEVTTALERATRRIAQLEAQLAGA